MKKIWSFLLILVAILILAGCSSKQAGESSEENNITLENLGEYKIGVLMGSTHDQFISKNYPDAQIFRFNNFPDLTTALTSRQCDVILAAEETVPELRSVDPSFIGIGTVFSEPLGAGFNKSNPELCNVFNGVLKNLQESGIYDSLRIKVSKKQFDDPIFAHPKTSGNKPIRVGIVVQNSNFCFMQNNGYYGIEPEFCRHLSDSTHRPIEFCVMDFGALIPSLISNKIDMIICTLCITEERQKQILFSEQYAASRVLAVVYQQGNNGNGNDDAVATSFFSKVKDSFYNNLVKEDRWKMIVDGLWETLIITIFAILFGTIIGCFICWMLMSHSKILQIIAKTYIEILRDVPILVFLMLMFYVVFASSNITATWVAIIAFALNFGAFTSVMFQTGIKGVARGQREAGLALGFSETGTFFHFIVPQAMTNIVPVFKNEAVSLLKNTSIVGYIAIQDLTKMSDIIRSRTFDAFFPLIVVSIIYFILAWLMGKGLDLLVREKKVRG